VLELQRALGNGAVARLIQTKLRVSQPGDPDEREADRIANLVVSMPEAAARQSIDRPVQEEDDDRDSEIRPKRLSPPADVAIEDDDHAAVEDRLTATKGAGRPIADDVRGFFEPRMQTDFSGVRIHTGQDAAELNRAFNARAFAHGRDIYFSPNQYRPDTGDGRQLLAHELTHVVQQGGARQGGVQRFPLGPIRESGTGVVQRVAPAVAALTAAEWIALGVAGYAVAQNAVTSTAGDVTYSFDEMEGVLLPSGGNEVAAYRKEHPDGKIQSHTHDIAVWGGKESRRKLGIRFGLDFNYDGHALGNISASITEIYDWPLWSGSVSVNFTPLSLSGGGIAKVRITLNVNYDVVGLGGTALSTVLELDGAGNLTDVRGNAWVSLNG
jgi:hypothetical protein